MGSLALEKSGSGSSLGHLAVREKSKLKLRFVTYVPVCKVNKDAIGINLLIFLHPDAMWELNL